MVSFPLTSLKKNITFSSCYSCCLEFKFHLLKETMLLGSNVDSPLKIALHMGPHHSSRSVFFGSKTAQTDSHSTLQTALSWACDGLDGEPKSSVRFAGNIHLLCSQLEITTDLCPFKVC